MIKLFYIINRWYPNKYKNTLSVMSMMWYSPYHKDPRPEGYHLMIYSLLNYFHVNYLKFTKDLFKFTALISIWLMTSLDR